MSVFFGVKQKSYDFCYLNCQLGTGHSKRAGVTEFMSTLGCAGRTGNVGRRDVSVAEVPPPSIAGFPYPRSLRTSWPGIGINDAGPLFIFEGIDASDGGGFVFCGDKMGKAPAGTGSFFETVDGALTLVGTPLFPGIGAGSVLDDAAGDGPPAGSGMASGAVGVTSG